jgi:hypothetical protein
LKLFYWRFDRMRDAGRADVKCRDVVGIDLVPEVDVIEQPVRRALRPYQRRLDLVILRVIGASDLRRSKPSGHHSW